MTDINNIANYSNAFLGLIPEIVIILAIIASLLWSLFFPKYKFMTSWFGLAATFIACLFLSFQLNLEKTTLINGAFVIDKLTVVFGLLVNFIGFIVILMTTGYEKHLKENVGEFYAILLAAIASVMLLAGANELILTFVALETLSIACVILTGFLKQDVNSQEACMKYLVSTACVTATLLYALSFVYGLTGSTSFGAIQDQLATLSLAPHSFITVLIIALVVSAVGFKLSVAPFHMWTPDVFEGAPTPVTAFLSIGSKIGGFALLLRLMIMVFGKSIFYWSLILSILSILSMIIGNITALSQKSFKRMLAYSSIAHIGYILIGVINATPEGLSASLFYLVIYGVMNLGAFSAAILFSNETNSDNIDDYSGLIHKRPILSLGLTVCLLNLAGLPIPPAGFLAKFFIFTNGFALQPMTVFGSTVINMGHILVFVGLITSIPAIFYYTRVVIKMIVGEPSECVSALAVRRSSENFGQLGPITALVFCVTALFFLGTSAVNSTMQFSVDTLKPLYISNDASYKNTEF